MNLDADKLKQVIFEALKEFEEYKQQQKAAAATKYHELKEKEAKALRQTNTELYSERKNHVD